MRRKSFMIIMPALFLFLLSLQCQLFSEISSSEKIERELQRAKSLQGKKAIRAYETILRKYPEFRKETAEARLGIALAYYWHLKNFKKAEEEFEKVITLFPEQKDKIAQAAHWIGSINQVDNLPKTVKYYQMAIQYSSPEDYHLHMMSGIGLASAYASAEQFELAIQTYRDLFETLGDQEQTGLEPSLNLESFYEQFSDLNESKINEMVTAYEKILQKYPTEKEEIIFALFRTATAYHNSQKSNEQLKQTERILKVYSSEEEMAQLSETQADVNATFALALELYNLDNDIYPSTQQGLRALVEKPLTEPVPANWKGPYVKIIEDFKDPWSNDYVYIYPSIHNKNSFDLYSKGKNGVGDGNDVDDINNWEKRTAVPF